jgi:hypothetical protein
VPKVPLIGYDSPPNHYRRYTGKNKMTPRLTSRDLGGFGDSLNFLGKSSKNSDTTEEDKKYYQTQKYIPQYPIGEVDDDRSEGVPVSDDISHEIFLEFSNKKKHIFHRLNPDTKKPRKQGKKKVKAKDDPQRQRTSTSKRKIKRNSSTDEVVLNFIDFTD